MKRLGHMANREYAKTSGESFFGQPDAINEGCGEKQQRGNPETDGKDGLLARLWW